MFDFISTIPAEVFDAIGVAGFGLYVLNYTLLTVRRLNSECIAYFVVNFLAASLVLTGMLSGFNLASMLIQVFWIGISTVAIGLRLHRRAKANREATSMAQNGQIHSLAA